MRVVDLFSAFLLLLLLLASPSHAETDYSSYSTSESSLTSNDIPSTTQTSPTITGSITSNTESSTMLTDSITSNTESSTMLTDSITSSTDSFATSTDSTTRDTSSSSTTTTTSTPPPGLNLFEDTLQELSQISNTLDAFSFLVNPDSAPSNIASASAGGYRGHPVGWWKLGTQTSSLPESTFCNGDNLICTSLNNELDTIDGLMLTLTDNMNDWGRNYLLNLTVARVKLQGTYLGARNDANTFRDSVDKDKFNNRIDEVKQNVEDASVSVEGKISDLTPQGSVILVAVIGSVGGLMMVGIISVMIYSAVMRVKAKKKLSSTPYNKNKGENILDDGLVADGPGSRQDSRTDPYSRPVASSVQIDPYAAPYGRRNEPNYRVPIVPRPRQGLPRTQF